MKRNYFWEKWGGGKEYLTHRNSITSPHNLTVMNREQIIETLKRDLSVLQNNYGADAIALFGSYARNEQQPGSDIDILVRMENADFSKLMALQRFLESRLNSKIDLVRMGSHLTPRFYNIVGKDIIYV